MPEGEVFSGGLGKKACERCLVAVTGLGLARNFYEPSHYDECFREDYYDEDPDGYVSYDALDEPSDDNEGRV